MFEPDYKLLFALTQLGIFQSYGVSLLVIGKEVFPQCLL